MIVTDEVDIVGPGQVDLVLGTSVLLGVLQAAQGRQGVVPLLDDVDAGVGVRHSRLFGLRVVEAQGGNPELQLDGIDDVIILGRLNIQLSLSGLMLILISSKFYFEPFEQKSDLEIFKEQPGVVPRHGERQLDLDLLLHDLGLEDLQDGDVDLNWRYIQHSHRSTASGC